MIAPLRSAGLAPDPIRVMVVDDAVVARGMMLRWIEAEPDMEMVGTLRSAREAIEQVERRNPDVVILDVNMPDLDGLAALPLLLQKKRDLVVLMASTLTRRNAETSLRALALGAADYVPKPESRGELATSDSFRRELVDKVRALGTRCKASGGARPAPVQAPRRIRPVVEEAHLDHHVAEPAGPIKLRPFPLAMPRVLLMGSSTGGPQALDTILGRIGSVIDAVPVLITQHMPPTFTTILAEHLARTCGHSVREAAGGEPVRPGSVYLARGGSHMRVTRAAGEAVIELDDGPPVHFCKPAVDPLFASAAAVWGAGTLALVLTGMGCDGTRGAADIVAAGGGVVVQDEGSSVVWGMPGSVAHAGLASAVLPLDQIAARVSRAFGGGRS
ncbi:MAG: chemotaxis response regulator protein-glutamate methylesterase [Hyphomicrobiales bacterium]|nr:chemotaxis response regulator protein-glutamate methylesterase [Hyphomicrobiales bacterium]